MNITKKEIRSYFSEIRKTIKNDISDAIINSKVLALKKIINADTVLLYASFGSEVNTWELAGNLIYKNIQTAFPLCGENGAMTFHIVKSLIQLHDGKYGISEPDISLPCPEITERTVCIVPALAFTANGGRLGYGGGYYDRFLSEYPEIYTIGLAYEQCVSETLPLEEHDVKVKSIITEERTIICHE